MLDDAVAWIAAETQDAIETFFAPITWALRLIHRVLPAPPLEGE